MRSSWRAARRGPSRIGYNAGLLCHRLGADNLASIDLDPVLIEQASGHLAGLGHQPVLVAGDGIGGVSEHGPYDRIIASRAVPTIPTAWIEQLRPAVAVSALVGPMMTEVTGSTLVALKIE